SHMSLYSSTSGFYTSLVKSYILSGENDTVALDMYRDAADSVESIQTESSGLFATSKTGLTYVREFDHQTKRNLVGSDCMSSEGCYLGAMLALGANEFQKLLPENETALNDTDIQRVN